MLFILVREALSKMMDKCSTYGSGFSESVGGKSTARVSLFAYDTFVFCVVIRTRYTWTSANMVPHGIRPKD